MAAASTTLVLVPLKLDAFVLNEACCGSDDYKIAPICQPNYTFLRLGLTDYLLESDLLDHVDLHAAKPAALNARVTNLGTGQVRRNRLGVYLHWVLPQFYREGVGSAGKAAENDSSTKQQAGFPSRSTDAPPLSGAATDTTAPEFRPVPNRWLITRRLKNYTPSSANMPIFQSWVVQSDAKRRLSDPQDSSLDNLDLEVDVSPFVDTTLVTKDGNIGDNIIKSQAEVFVGKCVDFEAWDRDAADKQPSVDLNVMTSANPLLVDYQPHNSNIFSIVDNFQYGNGQYLDTASADYSVIGWHSRADDDPMTTDPRATEVPSHGKRLANCNMALKDFDPVVTSNNKEWGAAAKKWFDLDGEKARSDSRILCHATMYDVTWSLRDPPSTVLAEKAGQIQKSLSFAVGTSPLDALVAFFDALAVGDASLQSSKDDILRLIHILGETTDGDIDSLQKFSDEAYNLAFAKYDAGTTWFWKQQSNAGEKPGRASVDDIANLDNLNLNQAALDNLGREAADLKWKLFAIWWSHVSSYQAQNHDQYYSNKLRDVLLRLITLGSTSTAGSELKALEDVIVKDSNPLKHTTGSSPSFFQRKDPTMLFAGIDSGWETDFSDTVQVRLHAQALPDDGLNPKDWNGHGDRFTHFASKVPDQVRPGVAALLTEFYALRTPNKIIAPPDSKTQALPYFHETNRDLFQDTQPWKPMFIEWEALYYHIPFDQWKPQEYAAENKYGAKVLQYAVKNDNNVSKNFDPKAAGNNDLIRIAGRNYLQPQSQSTFKTLLQNVFQNTNPDDLQKEFGVTKANQQQLVDTLTSGKFVSAPLSAITNALLTRNEGAHLKPLVRLPHAKPVAMKEAVDTFARICPTDLEINGKPLDPTSILQLIDDRGDLTPFGSSVAIDMKFFPFKPVQHGQLQFIKLNIVDKFGQAIHLIDPTSPVDGLFNTTSPIISDSLTVGTFADPKGSRANTALVQTNFNACPFIALPPSINQPARINACFVQKELVGEDWKWRRISDWDSPVWGWVVVNYADSGLQFFLDNGQFYREVRFSARGTSTDFKYLPFNPPKTDASSVESSKMKQLDYLIAQFSDPDYLQGFWDMINNSFTQASFSQAPTSYGSYTSAIVGRPLALVNAGWSLELADAPFENWTTSDIAATKSVPAPQPPKTLLNQDKSLRWANRQWAANDDKGFTFHVKIGDASRRYDGLVGYFLPVDTPLQASSSDLKLDHIYTFNEFIQNSQNTPLKKDPRTKITPDNYPLHTPYWMAPDKVGGALDRHDDKLKVLGLLMDPFLPVHAFSGILPTQALTLPPWIVEEALKNMTAFWHVGPLLVPQDVDLSPSQLRPLDASYTETLAQYAHGDNADGSTPTKDGSVQVTGAKLPSVQLPLSPPISAANGGGAKFMYLQPYLIGTGDGGAEANTRFNPYVIDGQSASGGDASVAKLYPGPYTALEGFIQVAKALDQVSSDTNTKSVTPAKA